MMTSRVVALCICLLLAPVAQAQTSGLVNTIIHGCTSGWTSGLCHSALNRASGLCKGQGNKGNCAQLFTELCQVNQRGYLPEKTRLFVRRHLDPYVEPLAAMLGNANLRSRLSLALLAALQPNYLEGVEQVAGPPDVVNLTPPPRPLVCNQPAKSGFQQASLVSGIPWALTWAVDGNYIYVFLYRNLAVATSKHLGPKWCHHLNDANQQKGL